MLQNRDWKNWEESLPVEAGDPEKHKRVASPRPGHADLAGALKYNFSEARYVLERASARESAARVAIGALAKLFLREFGNRGIEPRNLGRGSALRATESPGNTFAHYGIRRSSAQLCRSRNRTAHESGSRPGAAHRRFASVEFLKSSRTTSRPV